MGSGGCSAQPCGGCSAQPIGAQALPVVTSMPKAAPPQSNVVPFTMVASPHNCHRTTQVITPGRQSPARLSPRPSPRTSHAQLPMTPTMQAAPQTMGLSVSHTVSNQSSVQLPLSQQALMRTVAVKEDGSRRSPLPQERRALGLLHQRLAGRVSGIVSVLSQPPTTARPQQTPHTPGQPGQPKQLQQQNRWQTSLRQRQPQQQSLQQLNLATAVPPLVPPLYQLGEGEPCGAMTPKASVRSSTPVPASSRSVSAASKGRRHTITGIGANAETSSDVETGIITCRSAESLSA